MAKGMSFFTILLFLSVCGIPVLAQDELIGCSTSPELSNPDFSNGWTGWYPEWKTGSGQLYPAREFSLAEAWDCKAFDVHQNAQPSIVCGFLPAGFYRLTFNAFYRYSRLDNAWSAYFNDDGTKKADPIDVVRTSPVVAYMNDFTKPLLNYFEYSTDVQYADENWMTGSYYTDPLQEHCYPEAKCDIAEAFSRGQYKDTLYCVLGNDRDTIRVGVKGVTNQNNDSWAVFSNFKMAFLGNDFETGKKLFRDIYRQYQGVAAFDALSYFSILVSEIEEAGKITKSDIARIAEAIEDMRLSATAIEKITPTDNNPRTEYYMLNGSRTTLPHKGFNIIRKVDDDGNVIVRKILIR